MNAHGHSIDRYAHDQASSVSSWGSDQSKEGAELSQEIASQAGESKKNFLNSTADRLGALSRNHKIRTNNLTHDFRIYESASRSLEEGGKFTYSQALQAKDEEVKENLRLFAYMNEVEQKAKSDEIEFRRQSGQLLSLASTQHEGGEKMKSLKTDDAATRKTEKKAPNPKHLEDLQKENTAAISASEETSTSNKESTPAKKSDSLAANATNDNFIRSNIRDRLRDSLRERLDRKPASLETTEAKDTLATFQGELAVAAQKSEENEKEAALSSALFAAKGPSFSMLHSETDAFVNEAIGELEDTQAGILQRNSITVFQRVKQYHDRCVRNGSVGSIR